MFNIDTILSSFDCKGTLLKWLKKIAALLENESLTDVQIKAVADGKAQMILTFEDGSIQASNIFDLPQGPTGATGAQGPKGDTGDGFNTLNKMIVSYADNVISVADGFQIDIATQFKTIVGDMLATASGTFTLPIEGTGTIICDVDEANKKINIHLDAAYKNKIDHALQLPTTAPTATQLVGVGTNNAQTMLGVGEGLAIVNNTLQNKNVFGNVIMSYNSQGIEFSFQAPFMHDTSKDIVDEIIALVAKNALVGNGFYSQDGNTYMVITEIFTFERISSGYNVEFDGVLNGSYYEGTVNPSVRFMEK